MWDLYKNNAQTISAAYQVLQESPATLPVPLHTAAEYYLDDYFDQLATSDTPFLTLKDKWILVEFSFVTVPVNLKQTLFNLQINGYQPVLAHPERYLYFSDDLKKYDDLHDAGCLFQMNLLSLTGYYGKGVQELGEYLVKKKYIDLLGTDLHHDRHLKALQTSPLINDLVQYLLDTGKILNPSLLD